MFNLGIDEMLVIGVLAAFFVDAKKLVQIFKWVRTTRAKLSNLQFDIEEKVDNYLKVTETSESQSRTQVIDAQILPNSTKDSDDSNASKSTPESIQSDTESSKEINEVQASVKVKQISQIQARQMVHFRISQLDQDDLNNFSRDAIEELEHFHKLEDAKTLAAFMPLDNEVQIQDYLVNWLIAGKTLFLPKTNAGQLDFYEIKSLDTLIPGKFGILEPNPQVHSLMMNPPDIFLIPGVAFGNQGERVGRGKGYYDKSLKNFKDSLKVGICFEKQVLSGYIAQNEWDIPMDYIVSSQRIIHPTQKAKV